MRRILLIAGVGGMMAMSLAPAVAREIQVGNCKYGELSRTHHEDPVTGETTIVVCDLGPISG